MIPGDQVHYWKGGRGHFGYLVKRGYKWAHVRHGDKVRRVPVEDVRPWPPSGEWNVYPVKRGRA